MSAAGAARDLDFGALAAEREREELASIFISSIAFERLAKGSKIVVLGNRGAGKTALLSMLAHDARWRGSVVVDLIPDDFAYELLSQTKAGEGVAAYAHHRAYAAAWKYLLWVLAMKHAVKAMPGLKTGSAKRVFTYLRDHHDNVEASPLSSLIGYLKRLEEVSVAGWGATVKSRELDRLYRLEEIEPLLDDLNEMATGKPLYLLVDELDRGWDASEEAVAFVAGLFQAATAITLRTPNVRVIMSLRRELYDNIPALYEDAQKVRDTIEVIEWNRDRLFELICRRIARSLGDGTPSNAEAWAAVMPEQVLGRPSFEYMVDMTLYRPRELIQLCSQVQDVDANADRLPFSEAAVLEAAAIYASERFKDIAGEYRFQYPDLGSVLETFRGCPRSLSRAELEETCLGIAVGERRVSKSAAWVIDMEPDQLIEILWRVGFLRAQTEPTAADPTGRFVGPHEVRTMNLHNVDRFSIHDMFANHLGCR